MDADRSALLCGSKSSCRHDAIVTSTAEVYGTCDSHPAHVHAIRSFSSSCDARTLQGDAQYFQHISSVHLVLAVGSVIIIACNLIAFILNAMIKDGSSCGMPNNSSVAQCGSPTSNLTFHLLEFWATFVFAIIQSLSITYAVLPTALCNRPNLLKLFILLNVGCTFTSAMLVTLDLDTFEILSHEVEYINETFMAMIDLVMLAPLASAYSGFSSSTMNIVIGSLAMLISIVQLSIYNSMGVTADGGMEGETPAHFFEFAFGILSASVTYWFVMDNKLFCDKQLEEIMYGPMEVNMPEDSKSSAAAQKMLYGPMDVEVDMPEESKSRADAAKEVSTPASTHDHQLCEAKCDDELSSIS